MGTLGAIVEILRGVSCGGLRRRNMVLQLLEVVEMMVRREMEMLRGEMVEV